MDEDQLTARITDRTSAAIAAGEDVAIPVSVWTDIEEGRATPLRAIRAWRGLSQAELGAMAGVPLCELADLEGQGRAASLDELRALARALAVPEHVLSSSEA